MKFVLISIFLTFSITGSAQEIIRLFDAKDANCQKDYDIIRSKKANVYTLSNPEIKIVEDDIKLKANIDFYECVKVGDQYFFQKLEQHTSASYSIPDINSGELITVYRHDKEKKVIAYTDNYVIADHSQIHHDGQQSYVVLYLHKSDLAINNFPNAQTKGDFYIDLMLQTITNTYTDDINLGYTLIGHGSFRIFFDI
ncbi:MAG: hypothetical protein HON90_15635 [Halobacteriovoraceae bacterium]|nr:hypothetical protein [Halobacteriovoraceae bacterium]